MQDPSLYAQINPTFPEQEHLKCPRCDSPNTKFCYYNNYNLSQPRHFCKSCKRYWTKGGALRNIPVGGASRKNTKRSSTTKKSSSPSPSSAAAAAKAASTPSSSSIPSTSSAIASSSSSSSKSAFDQGRLDMSGNFSTLLGSSNGGHFGNLIDGVSQNGSNLHLGEFGNVHNPGSGSGEARNVDPHLGLQIGGDGDNASCWNGGNGWPGLAVYTPGSSYQTSKG